MARTAVNPKVLGKDRVLTSILAEDAKTWYKGQIGILTSGTVTPASTSSVVAYCIFAEDQTTATSASTVDVYVLQDGDLLEIYAYDTNQVSAIAQSDVGTRLGCITASNISYIDLNETTGQFEVVELASLAMPERSAYDGDLNGVTGTTAGLCTVKFRTNVS